MTQSPEQAARAAHAAGKAAADALPRATEAQVNLILDLLRRGKEVSWWTNAPGSIEQVRDMDTQSASAYITALKEAI